VVSRQLAALVFIVAAFAVYSAVRAPSAGAAAGVLFGGAMICVVLLIPALLRRRRDANDGN